MTNRKNIPAHVAVVMDGNGRWAKTRGINRIEGHRRGADVALDIVKHAAKREIRFLTLYTFSSENWQRPQDEVQGLMEILYENLLKEADSLVKNGVRLGTIGAIDKLPKRVQTVLIDVQNATRDCDKLHLTLALSYGSRDEIVRACRKVVEAAQSQKIRENQIDEKLFASFLDTRDIPDPDVVIRTSGDTRLSNFLLWQSSYSEFFFTKVLWPDFSREYFDAILDEFSERERRFGKISNN